jgi:hypothetical protein
VACFRHRAGHHGTNGWSCRQRRGWRQSTSVLCLALWRMKGGREETRRGGKPALSSRGERLKRWPWRWSPDHGMAPASGWRVGWCREQGRGREPRETSLHLSKYAFQQLHVHLMASKCESQLQILNLLEANPLINYPEHLFWFHLGCWFSYQWLH